MPGRLKCPTMADMSAAGLGLTGRRSHRLADRVRRVPAGTDWPNVAAALLGLVAVIEALAWGYRSGSLLLILLLALASTVPVVLVLIQPALAAALITGATVLTTIAFGRPLVAALGALVISLYALARNRSRVAALLLVALLLAYAGITSSGTDRTGRLPAMLVAALAATAAVAGIAQRARTAAVRRKADSQDLQDSLLAHAARGERARIARELHDVVAHHISMIALQAEAARLTTAGMPADGQQWLRAIGDTARTALTEMRRLLGVLREDVDAEPSRQPQPGLRQMNDLLDEARGLTTASTRLIVSGTVTRLDPGVELTAYRIAQEALTNARRHAPGAAVDVGLYYGGDTLRLRVRDNGPGPSVTDGQLGRHGISGMQERAALVGGRLSAGPAIQGGFLIEAVLPTQECRT